MVQPSTVTEILSPAIPTLALLPSGEGGAKCRMRALPQVQREGFGFCVHYKTLIRPSGTFPRRGKGEN